SLPYATVNAAKFESLPAVCSGGMNNTVFEEEMVKVAPDVIISTSTDPAADDELQQKLNIPVISVHMNDYDIFEDRFYKSLSMLGEVFGTTEQTDSVIKAMKEWQADLEKRSGDIPNSDKPSVYTGGISYRGPHGIEGTYGGYGPFEAIGAKNVVDETGKTGPFSVDLEQITVWDPQYIFLNPENMAQVNEEFANDAAFFENLQAVKGNHVFSQPSYIAFGTNYELAIADAYFVGKTIYPDKFADVDMDAKADEIFTTVLGGPYMSIMKEDGVDFGPIAIGA
ncbi:MAG: ABC transporter substrate-binding protein, partial [Eggerthellaceae bacterium]|nr:ABC transporter substrate-binding protein [Eggerthellaceae bacterium]